MCLYVCRNISAWFTYIFIYMRRIVYIVCAVVSIKNHSSKADIHSTAAAAASERVFYTNNTRHFLEALTNCRKGYAQHTHHPTPHVELSTPNVHFRHVYVYTYTHTHIEHTKKFTYYYIPNSNSCQTDMR